MVEINRIFFHSTLNKKIKQLTITHNDSVTESTRGHFRDTGIIKNKHLPMTMPHFNPLCSHSQTHVHDVSAANP